MRRHGADKESASLAIAGSVPDLTRRGSKGRAISDMHGISYLQELDPGPLSNSVTETPSESPRCSEGLDVSISAAV
jgi:hypothetical protein